MSLYNDMILLYVSKIIRLLFDILMAENNAPLVAQQDEQQLIDNRNRKRGIHMLIQLILVSYILILLRCFPILFLFFLPDILMQMLSVSL